jgi:hypothetical protein
MTQLEDQLRKAFRAKANDITPPPPPLELRPRPVLGPAVHRGSGWLGTPPRRRWLVPLAAAAAVLAVVAGALVVTNAVTAQRKPPTAPTLAGIPPYYVSLTSVRPMPVRKPQVFPVLTTATVRTTSTGAAIASVPPPRPYREFTDVSAAADDRYFVLAAQENLGDDTFQDGFFLLRINPTATDPAARATLAALPAAGLPGDDELQAMALSPNGRLLAMVAQHFNAATRTTAFYLRVYNLATGRSRTWPGAAYQQAYVPGGTGGLSWRQDSRFLAIPWNFSAPSPELRLLNVNARSHALRRDSTPLAIPRVPCPGVCFTNMTPDGKTIFVASRTGYASASQPLWDTLVRFSLQTGALTRVNKLTIGGRRGRYIGYNPGSVVGPDDVLWTSYDGSNAIVAEIKPGTPNAGVYSGNRYTPIPWPANIVGAAW